MPRVSGPAVAPSARLAALTRFHGADDPRTLEASAELRMIQLRLTISEAVKTSPPLTAAERDELHALLDSAA